MKDLCDVHLNNAKETILIIITLLLTHNAEDRLLLSRIFRASAAFYVSWWIQEGVLIVTIAARAARLWPK